MLGIANNRLIRIDLNVDEVVKTWRYNTMRQWNVNWDIKQVCCSVSNMCMSFGSALIQKSKALSVF